MNEIENHHKYKVFFSKPGSMVGIVLILFGTVALAGMDGIGKAILEDGVSVFQMLAIRGWIIVPVLLVMAFMQDGGAVMRTKRPIGHSLRAAAGIVATVCFFIGVRDIPLADAVVIFFCAPLLMTAASGVLLGEHVGPARWLAVCAGFVGVIIAMQPGTEAFQIGSVYVFVGSCAYASIGLFNRWLGDTEPTIRLVLYFNVALMIACSAIAPVTWQAIALTDLGSYIALACVALAGHFLVTAAYCRAPVSTIAPFEYTTIIWALLFGVLFWDDTLSLHILAGAVLIAASGIAVVKAERTLQRAL